MSLSKPSDERQLAEAIRQACLQSALAAYEEARMDGLCHEGAWEMAVSAFDSALQTRLRAGNIDLNTMESLDDLARFIVERDTMPQD